MKILLVGSDYNWSIERFYRSYLGGKEVEEVRLFAAQNLFYSFYERSAFHKILFRAGLSGVYKKINDALLREVDSFMPDVIWVFKGMEVLPATLKLLRKKNIRLVNFNGDNPFLFSGRGSGNKNVIASVPLYDLHFTYNLQVKATLEKEYHLPVAYLPFGFDVAEDIRQQCRHQQEMARICFVGNPDAERTAFILQLADAGLPIDVYGSPEWSRFLSHPAITVLPAISGADLWKVLAKYRVQLNLMRPHNEDSHNMRTFEVPAIGGIMLAPATTEHLMFFRNGEEAFFFTGIADCVRKARHILALSAGEADLVRAAARRRSVEAGYSYKDRARTAREQLLQLHAKTGDRTF